MRRFSLAFLLGAILLRTALPAAEPAFPLNTDAIRIRDPYIFAHAPERVYLMYAQTKNRPGSERLGVEVYASQDLAHWTQPRCVLALPADKDITLVWAPEMHQHQGKYYLLVTLTFGRTLPGPPPVTSRNWPKMYVRGTYVFVADSPYGPFQPVADSAPTPEDWMALDGTLYVEDGRPFMVFCHEWVQLIDGTIDAVPLRPDLSAAAEKPQPLFRASQVPGANQSATAGKVTDGCFLYRSPKSGKLFMTWSTYLPHSGYCVVLSESQSGKLAGPWIGHKPIYTRNGGHGMLFRSFDGRLLMPLHQPNTSPDERLHVFEVIDHGDTLTFGEEIDVRAN